MKKLTKQILDKLNNESLLKSLEGHLNSYPDSTEGDVTFHEAYVKFNLLRTSVQEYIQSESFEKVCSLNRRKVIDSHLNNLVQQQSHVNQTINNIEIVYDNLLIAGALDPYQDKASYQEKFAQLSKLIKKYNGYIKQFEKAGQDLDFIAEQRQNLEQLLNRIVEKKKEADAALTSINETKSRAANEGNQLTQALEKARSDGEQIETQKSKINAFFKNVDEHRRRIEHLEADAQAIIDKRETVDNLIEEAKSALKLGSAAGISAAFAAQYEAANDKEIYNSWLLGAGAFLAVALALTVWVVGGWWITDPTSISSIIGRVVAVGVAISGATFCARRYVSQKNLAEDYAYKATLSKSIVAFKDEIKSGDPKQVAEYLTTVLAEIHKDPMRSRSESKEDLVVSQKNLNILEKLKGLLK